VQFVFQYGDRCLQTHTHTHTHAEGLFWFDASPLAAADERGFFNLGDDLVLGEINSAG
jgi:hypothetical protein